MTDRIAELEAELAELKAAREAELKARMESVKPVMRYTLKPAKDNGFDRIADPSCRWYRLEGEITNRAELEAVGRTDHRGEGGMNYLFNNLSGRFVLASGGGTIYLHLTDRGWGVKEPDTAAFEELAELVRTDPEAEFDVTEQVRAGIAARGAS